MNIARLTSVFLFVLCLTNPVYAATDLGSGYSCDGGKILKKGKEVKLSKLVATIDTQLSNLGNSKKDKAKKTVLKALKKSLKDCSKNKPTPTPAPGGSSVSSVYSSRNLGNSTRSGPISGFGDAPAFALLQLREETNGSFLISISIGENAPTSERYFSDFEPGPFVQIPGTASLPYTTSTPQGASTKTITVEATKVTFRWSNIPAGSTNNGSNVTEVIVVLTLGENNTFTGTLQYVGGVSGSFSF